MSKEELASLLISMQSEKERLEKEAEILKQNLAVLVQQTFGRKTEKTEEIVGQLQFNLDNGTIVNEVEVLTAAGTDEEPVAVTNSESRKKAKGKRKLDLSRLETTETVEHELSEEELNAEFPNGYKELPADEYNEVIAEPAKFKIIKHRVHKYADKKDDKIVRAARPERLLDNSILSTSLFSEIFNGKFVNSLPLNRMSEEYKRLHFNINRQTMAGWLTKVYDRYLKLVVQQMHGKLLESKLIHCDETPFKCLDDRSPGSKSYMWVYHSPGNTGGPPIYIYDYSPTRRKANPENFLGDYKGVLVTDGYQVYRSLVGGNTYLTLAACWTHAKRMYTDLIKTAGEGDLNKPVYSAAALGVKKIAEIYHIDNMAKGKSPEEILRNRQENVKPLVDEYFKWVHQAMSLLDKSSKTYKALQYSSNLEQYLRTFLENPIVPLDNNDAERSIRTFCVGKKNWQIVGSPNGAYASGCYYSIAETAKANGLKPREYMQYLLDEMLRHMDDAPSTYLESLMPWSDTIPDYCKDMK